MKVENTGSPPVGRVLSNSLWSMASLVFAGIVQAVSIPIVIHRVSTADYGVYVLVLTVGGLVGLADLGLNEATIRYVAKYHAEQDWAGVNRVYGATLSVYCIVGVLCAAVLIGAAPWIVGTFKIDVAHQAMATSLLRCTGITFLVTIWVGVLEAIPQAILRNDVLGKARFLFLTIHAFGTIVVVTLGFGVLGLGVWLLTARVIYLTAIGAVARRLIPTLRFVPTPTHRGLKEVFSYGVFSSLNAIIAKVAESADRIILGLLFGPREVAYLSVPKQLLDFAASINGAGGSVLFPVFSSMTTAVERTRAVFNKSLAALTCLGLIVFVPSIVVLPDFLRMWIGSEFSIKSSLVAQLIAFSYALQAPFVVYFTFLKGTGRVHWLTAINATFGVISPAITFVLISKFGFLGAGLRTLALVWVGYVLIGIILKRLLLDHNAASTVTRLLLAPIGVALVFCLVALQLEKGLPQYHWLGIAVVWSITAVSFTILLAVVTYVLQGPDSPTCLAIERLRMLRIRRASLQSSGGR